jgi:hypothetical protein
LAVSSAVVLILVTETGILALLSGSLAGVLTASNDLGTNRGGCGNEALIDLDMENLSYDQSKKAVRAGLPSWLPKGSLIQYRLEIWDISVICMNTA